MRKTSTPISATESGKPHRGPRSNSSAPAQLPAVNPLESPLAWLRRRKDKDGRPMISAAEFEAGERLRSDYTFGQLMASVTQRWSSVGASDGRPRGSSGGATDLADNTMAARERVNRALASVGPELSGILVDVCCHLRGLEDAERTKGWPLRSAKVVLQLALQRLARHYGLLAQPSAEDTRRPAPVRHWGGEGYRPAIGSSGQPD